MFWKAIAHGQNNCVKENSLFDKTDLSGSVLVTKAYNAGLPFNIGMYLVAIGIIFFSFTTILGWNYYGERCVLYLTGKTGSIKIFKIVYILAIATAPFLTLEPIWLMAFEILARTFTAPPRRPSL